MMQHMDWRHQAFLQHSLLAAGKKFLFLSVWFLTLIDSFLPFSNTQFKLLWIIFCIIWYHLHIVYFSISYIEFEYWFRCSLHVSITIKMPYILWYVWLVEVKKVQITGHRLHFMWPGFFYSWWENVQIFEIPLKRVFIISHVILFCKW
jgi:hypothetical protein